MQRLGDGEKAMVKGRAERGDEHRTLPSLVILLHWLTRRDRITSSPAEESEMVQSEI